MRNVLVTGGSRGLGLGIAQRLAASGYRVLAVSRKTSDQLAAAIKDADAHTAGIAAFRSVRPCRSRRRFPTS